ncbi:MULTISPECIES: hypothetical protein [Phaeobacter]|uniref:hypothetical protein n=1 Tax=Phaeobacter TaxID=302485 RepID=UPI0005916D19|nr:MULTISPECIES: hypothetical protein [Phaeobacter]AUQ89383.1 hypothetical protein PhaeoP24_00737 [Phaeobacter inhibens]KII12598.1 hypothetical protein OO25_17080 [Phaeobacter sp. S60]
MAEAARPFGLIDSEDLFEYPIPSGERLDSHFFMAWRFDWWLQSEFRLMADKDVRAVGFDLFNIAQKEDPVGTLPTDDRLLARLVGESLEEWERLQARPIGPLYNWRKCVCDNGRQRLYHPVVLKIAQDALGMREDKLAKREAERERKRLEALPEKMLRAGAPKGMTEDQGLLLRFDQFLVDNFDANGQRRAPMIRKALEAFSLAQEGVDWRAEMSG